MADRRQLRGLLEMMGEVAEINIADFSGELTANGQIAVPPEIASQVPPGERVRVVLQWGASEDDSAWRMAGRRQFDSAYDVEDSIYEQLIDGSSTR
jgi:hypothetical protein